LVMLGLLVNATLRANSITTSVNTSNINANLYLPSYSPTSIGSTIVGSTITNSTTTYTTPTTYATPTTQTTNLCIMSFCGSTSTNINIAFPVIGNMTFPTMIGTIPTVINTQYAALPIGTTVTVPTSVVQPSNVSTVTTNIPTIQITTNFNTLPLGSVGALAGDPEPSTVILLVSGMAALGILHRKRFKIGRV
jgi:hypothetical protein